MGSPNNTQDNIRGKVRETINKLAAERVLILDGATGSEIAKLKLNHEGYNDLLCLTRPEIISVIHENYLKAGADIIETCSFNAASMMLENKSLAGQAYSASRAAAELARKAADKFSTAEKPRFVAGSVGPTAKSASMATDLSDLSKRAANWDEFEAAYYENVRGLLDGGVDLILIETIFDTLNAKAAIFAAQRLAKERGIDIPLIVSATLTEGGRLLSGQTVEAFCVSVMHAEPLALGLNCSFGAEKLKSHVAAISAAAPCLVIAYPNAGLPNSQGEYEESPASMALKLENYLEEGLVNIVGGCCGSAPAHIAAIAEKVQKYKPRPLPELPKRNLFAGLEVMELDGKKFSKAANGISIETTKERNREFTGFIKEGDYDSALDLLGESLAEVGGYVCIYMDDTLPNAKAAMTGFINFALQYPDIARHPLMLESSSWDLIEAGLKCLQGKALVNYTGPKGGEAELSDRACLVRFYGAAIVGMLD